MAKPKSNTTPAPAPSNDIPETVTHNGVVITLKRAETERVREGKEAVTYWTVDLNQFRVMVPGKDNEGKPTTTLDVIATLKRIETVYTFDTLLDNIQAKTNQNLRAAQMDTGKDVYDMPAKLNYAKAYITGGWGATRQVTKSPYDMAQADFQSAMSALNEKLKAGLITPVQHAEGAKAALDAMQARLIALAQECASRMIAAPTK